MTRDRLEDWLVRRVAALTGRDPEAVDPDTPLASLGVESADAVGLTAELEDLLGRAVDPEVVFERPTVTRLAAALAAPAATGRTPVTPAGDGGETR